MKKRKLLILLFLTSLNTNAQYFEGFEKGVPGTMLQTCINGDTSWINFGLSALNVETAISEKNSAVFFNAMESKIITTSLQTPVLNLSDPKMCLEFKYLQRERTLNYANILEIELSNDGGNSWGTIATYNETMKSTKNIHIDLAKFNPTSQSCIKFKCTQLDPKKGFPIVIDDISLDVISRIKSSIDVDSGVKIFPNPSSGIFTISNIESVNVSIYDCNGRNVYTAESISDDMIVDLSLFAKGIYIAKIKGTNIQEVKKIIIQ
jgi:hypothetical protein